MAFDNSTEELLDESLDVRQYINLLLHWSWLILLSAFIAGLAAYLISKNMTPYYQSSTVVFINEAPGTKSNDYSSLMLSEQLATTYAQMVDSSAVLNEVIEELKLDLSADELQKMITATPINNTQLIRITVEAKDAQLAANIANSVSQAFSTQIYNLQAQRYIQSQTSLEKQMSDTEKQISNTTLQIESVYSEETKATLSDKLTQLRSLYNILSQSYQQVRLAEAQSTSTITQIEPAAVNRTPVKPKILQNTLLAAVVGLLLTCGLIITREALDDTIKTPDDITKKFDQPLLGVINHYHKGTDTPLITLSDPRSPTAEAYRSIRTNISFASVDRPLKAVMITSTEPHEGKTTTISNLGVVLAQNGKKVLIADCDLRRPQVHAQFDLMNRQGISSLLRLESDYLDGSKQATKIENLSVVTSGSLPPNPAELLGSQKMSRIIKNLQNEADIVLIDTPPMLAVTDAAILAPALDGVIVVVKPGVTHKAALRQTIIELKNAKARILGIIINDARISGSHYGYSYRNYRDYSAYHEYYNSTKKKKSIFPLKGR